MTALLPWNLRRGWPQLADRVDYENQLRRHSNSPAACGHRDQRTDRRWSTHIGHTAAEIVRPTAAIRSITATAPPRKHSLDASQQPFALNPWAERAW